MTLPFEGPKIKAPHTPTMPKPCMCKLIPGILRRLDALEQQFQPNEDSAELKKLDEQDAQLDELEAQLNEAEKVNSAKFDDLKDASEKMNQIKKSISALMEKTAQGPTSEQEEMLAENQKVLMAYAATW